MNFDNIVAERKNKTIYRDGDKCVKVFNSSFAKADILNEALNQARVEDCGLNVPKILEVTTVDGKWAGSRYGFRPRLQASPQACPTSCVTIRPTRKSILR